MGVLVVLAVLTVLVALIAVTARLQRKAPDPNTPLTKAYLDEMSNAEQVAKDSRQRGRIGPPNEG